MKTKGVVLMAFGKPAYMKMAFNMAASLRATSPDIKIVLIYEDGLLSTLWEWQREYFDELILIESQDLFDNFGDKKLQKLNPGKAKTRIYKYLPFDYNIYLDVDGCALRDINPLFDICIENGSYYLSQIVGYHTIDKGRDFREMQWAWADDIWEEFNLLDTDVLPAINSSFSFISKCDEAKMLYDLIQQNIENPISSLRMPWGGTQPDELYTNIALAQMDTKCDVGLHPVFFATRNVPNWKPIKENHYVLGIFGGVGFSHSSVTAMYDRLMHCYCAKLGILHLYKSHQLMKDKHANKRAAMT